MKQQLLIILCIATYLLNGSQMHMQEEKKLQQKTEYEALRTMRGAQHLEKIFASTAGLEGLLKRAIDRHDGERALILIKAGAPVNTKSRIGRTTLMNIARYDSTDTVQFLIDAGAQLDLQDNRGQTALMHTAGGLFPEPAIDGIIQFIMNLDADEATNWLLDKIKLLVAAGANTEIKNEIDGNKTAIDYAAPEKQERMRTAIKEGKEKRSENLKAYKQRQKEAQQIVEEHVPVSDLANIITGYSYGDSSKDLPETKQSSWCAIQ